MLPNQQPIGQQSATGTTGLYPAAQQWFNSPTTPYFPGQQVAGFTGNQQTGWDTSIENLQGMQGAAQGMAQTGQQAWDKYNSFDPFNNPALADSVTAMQQSMQKAYDRSVHQQTASNAIAAGGYGGSRQGIAEGIARGDFMDTMGKNTADMYTSAYNQGLGRQTALLQGQPGMLNATNQLAMQPYQVGNKLAQAYGNIGSTQQQQNQNQINANMNEWQYYRDAPLNKLTGMSNLLAPGLGVAATSTGPNPNAGNPIANAIGGAAAGYGVGQSMGGFDWLNNQGTSSAGAPITPYTSGGGYGSRPGLGL